MPVIKGELEHSHYLWYFKKKQNTSATNRRGLLSGSKESCFPRLTVQTAKIFIVLFFFMPNCLHHQTLHVGVLKTSPGHLDLYLNSISVTLLQSCSFKYHVGGGFKCMSLVCAPDSYLQLPLNISMGCLTGTAKLTHPIPQGSLTSRLLHLCCSRRELSHVPPPYLWPICQAWPLPSQLTR